MEPSVKAAKVFLFSKPGVGETFGFTYDGWHDDGSFTTRVMASKARRPQSFASAAEGSGVSPVRECTVPM